MKSFVQKVRAYAVKHKILSIVIVCFVIFAVYRIANSGSSASVTKYVVADAQLGTVIESVAGSGQVSALEQIPVQNKASGNIVSLPVKNGDEVKTGELLAQVDTTQAAMDLENAQLNYEKFVEPATALSLSQAEDSVSKAYDSGWSATSNLFIDLPNILTGLNDLLNTANGYLSENNTRYINDTAFALRNTAADSYGAAETQFQSSLADYKNVTRQSATSTLTSMINEAYTTAKVATTAVKDTKNTLDYIQSISSSQTTQQTAALSTAETNASTWTNEANGDLSSLLSALTSITESTESLQQLQNGPDPLDVASQQLSLQEAQNTYANYFIRAPIDGTFALADGVQVNAAAPSTIGTIISDQKIATISLNEVDASKVSVGQPVTLTFDAIDGLTIAGKVSQVDLIGTVSQGVVTYNITITFETNDPRVKSGMSVNATIDTQVAENVITVPVSAVTTQGNNSYVQMFSTPIASNPSGTESLVPPKRVPVQVGISDNTSVEILSGLKVGDQVVTRTVASSSSAPTTAASAAPSIFSAAGAGARGAGGFGGGGGAVRVTTGGTGVGR